MKSAILCSVLLLAVLAAYANHFQNEFHFDDSHTITNNLYIESLRNIPRFFTDASTFSTQPDLQTYRPVTSASLAIDYWLGRGRKPFFFHLSTFFWYAVQLVLMFLLFRRVMDAADPHPSNIWTALVATACYGLHPANAETVNYIIQRGDLYNTLGVVASIWCFAAFPSQRKYGWYVLPAAIAILAKAPALIFPAILLVYVLLFEVARAVKPAEPRFIPALGRAFAATLPAWLMTAAAAFLTLWMTPPAFHGGASSAALYRLTQPWVALHYFRSFFLPTTLSADTDWTYISPFSAEAFAGYLFVIAVLAAIAWTARRPETRPVAFGLAWFVLALLPTSLMALMDVTNDHRMFFPFVGLALAVFWGLRLALFRRTARLTTEKVWIYAAVAASVAACLAAGAGTWQRNRVWHTEESLWRDVTIKSPGNARGLMNYSLAFLTRQDFATALPYLQRAAQLAPTYAPAEANLGIAYSGLNRDDEAARHFERALELSPGNVEPHLIYARWLNQKGRFDEARTQLETTLRNNPQSFPARDLLMQVYAEQGNREALDHLLEDTVALAFNEDVARRYMKERSRRETPESLVNLSAQYCNAGNYTQCLSAARQALELRPDFAEAYSNMAAALIALQKWDEGIEAARHALRLKPDSAAAKNNLDWALQHKPR
jgi:tetratricopeptide (TPR) repeat protein